MRSWGDTVGLRYSTFTSGSWGTVQDVKAIPDSRSNRAISPGLARTIHSPSDLIGHLSRPVLLLLNPVQLLLLAILERGHLPDRFSIGESGSGSRLQVDLRRGQLGTEVIVLDLQVPEAKKEPYSEGQWNCPAMPDKERDEA